MGILKRLFRRDPKTQLQQMAGKFELPAFPQVAMEVRALLRNEDSTNEQIGACIKRDPGLTLRLLQSVNSAAMSRRRSIADPVQAVALIGRANLEFVVLGHATRAAIPDASATGFSQDEFWEIAVRRASLAERLAKTIKPSEAGISYAASLLQDMAVPVLANVMSKEYRPVLAQVDGRWDVLDEHEQATFGWDHGEFGGWMCEAWTFPDSITSAITSHHRDTHEGIEVPGAVRAVSFLHSIHPTDADADRLAQVLDEAFGVSTKETRELLRLHFGSDEAA